MTVAQMRCAIYDIYPGDVWHRRVEDMPDDQVVAVYHSLLSRGAFRSHSTDCSIPVHITITEKATDEQTFKPFVGEQLTLF